MPTWANSQSIQQECKSRLHPMPCRQIQQEWWTMPAMSSWHRDISAWIIAVHSLRRGRVCRRRWTWALRFLSSGHCFGGRSELLHAMRCWLQVGQRGVRVVRKMRGWQVLRLASCLHVHAVPRRLVWWRHRPHLVRAVRAGELCTKRGLQQLRSLLLGQVWWAGGRDKMRGMQEWHGDRQAWQRIL